MEILRDDRCRCSSGLTLQLQWAVDDDRVVRHLVRSVNERRDCGRGWEGGSPGVGGGAGGRKKTTHPCEVALSSS